MKTTTIGWALAALMICSVDHAWSQDGCVYAPSGKIQKLLDQSFDMKKYETNERIEFLE
jgi:hypothetical protein